MPFNGAGTYNLYTPGTPFVTGTSISSTVMNAVQSDIATGLSTVICKDGQTTVTANIPMATFKLTGLGAGSSTGDSVRYEQVINTTSWTPVLTFATPGDLTRVESAQVGRATRIGNMVHLDFVVICSTFNHTTASGILQITGCPYTSLTLTAYAAYGAVKWGGITKANYTNINAEIGSNSAIIGFSASGSAQSASSIVAADVPTGGGNVAISGSISFLVA